MVRWLLAAVLGCSRATPIAADPVTAPADAAPAPPLADKYFMDTSESAPTMDCYRDVHCKASGPKCDEKNEWFDKKWTAKIRAKEGDVWCCTSSTLCEFRPN